MVIRMKIQIMCRKWETCTSISSTGLISLPMSHYQMQQGLYHLNFFETPNKTLISGQTSKKCDPARQGDPICVVYERWTGVVCVHKEPTFANHWTNLPCICVHVCVWYMCAYVWDILVSRLSAPENFPKLLRVSYQHCKKGWEKNLTIMFSRFAWVLKTLV